MRPGITTSTWSIAALLGALCVVQTPVLAQPATLEAFYQGVDGLLSQHVRAGRVDYAAIRQHPAPLDALLKTIAGIDRAALAAADDKAFLVNAYNILVIKTVVDRPALTSPLDDPNFFSKVTYPVAGSTLSLDDLEKKVLYVAYPDARLHFALVCAALGCPELIPEAYRGSALDAQLDRQTRQALASPQILSYDPASNTARLSELFTWYASDFTRHHPSVLAFINAYRTPPIPENASIQTLPYDWKLNQ